MRQMTGSTLAGFSAYLKRLTIIHNTFEQRFLFKILRENKKNKNKNGKKYLLTFSCFDNIFISVS